MELHEVRPERRPVVSPVLAEAALEVVPVLSLPLLLLPDQRHRRLMHDKVRLRIDQLDHTFDGGQRTLSRCLRLLIVFIGLDV